MKLWLWITSPVRFVMVLCLYVVIGVLDPKDLKTLDFWGAVTKGFEHIEKEPKQ